MEAKINPDCLREVLEIKHEKSNEEGSAYFLQIDHVIHVDVTGSHFISLNEPVVELMHENVRPKAL